MVKPPPEFLALGLLFPIFFREGNTTVGLVVVEDLLKLAGAVLVKNERIDLEVPEQTPAVQIGRADKGNPVVHHHNLAVMESALEEVDLGSLLLEFAHIVLHNPGSNGYVAFLGHHDFYLHTAF